MTVVEKINAARKILFGDAAPAAPADPTAQGKTFPLTDGTTITLIPDLAQGAQALIAGQPAPDGEYPMPDGSTVVVAGGVVASIESKAVEGAEGDGAGAPGNMDMDKEWMKKQMEQLISKFRTDLETEYKEKFETLKAENADLKQKFSAQTEGMKQLLEVVTEIAKEPEAAPTDPRKAAFAKEKESKEEKIKQMGEAMKKWREEAK